MKMNKYVQHLALTAWRKKSSLLLAVGLLLIIIFGLQYTKVSDKPQLSIHNIPQILAQTIIDTANKVKFVDSRKHVQRGADSPRLEMINNGEIDLKQSTRDVLRAGKASDDVFENMEQQLGIPHVNLDTKNPYIPKRRIVHFDLKGAPPLPSFYKKYFPLIKNLGATGFLMEYEDMFPFEGRLKNISAKNAYTKSQIADILSMAKESNLEVIPLIQTFGHVEFALKLADFDNLREVPGSPQALCPSRNKTIEFIQEMVDQVMALHTNIQFLHIGCDEVFQMGECDVCRLELHETLFLKHVRSVANMIHEKYPKLQLIIWDDMLRHLSQQTMIEMDLGKLVDPMVWVYAEDIYRFVQPLIWDKYTTVFKRAWAASAFKGAFGETLYVPDARRHLENNLRWLDVMSQQSASFKQGFLGLVLTGWQRYDHFAILCELLPVGTPSLALSLTAVTHGYFNSSLKNNLLSSLSCPQPTSTHTLPFIALDSDPFLLDKLGRCMFPGSHVFRLIYRLHSSEIETKDYLRQTKEQKSWLTNYNIRHNYSLPLRVDELTADLPRVYHGMISLVRAAYEAMVDVFDNYTITEWIEQRIYPYIIELETIQNKSIALKNIIHWPSRPVPPLKDLHRFGIPIPEL